MSEIDRYDMIASNAGNYMEIRSDGDWVEIDEYERLKSINAELLAACKDAVEELADLKPPNVLVTSMDGCQNPHVSERCKAAIAKAQEDTK